MSTACSVQLEIDISKIPWVATEYNRDTTLCIQPKNKTYLHNNTLAHGTVTNDDDDDDDDDVGLHE